MLPPRTPAQTGPRNPLPRQSEGRAPAAMCTTEGWQQAASEYCFPPRFPQNGPAIQAKSERLPAVKSRSTRPKNRDARPAPQQRARRTIHVRPLAPHQTNLSCPRRGPALQLAGRQLHLSLLQSVPSQLLRSAAILNLCFNPSVSPQRLRPGISGIDLAQRPTPWPGPAALPGWA